MSSRKKAIVEEILSWLDANYELSDGVCIPRCLLYHHYLDSCRLKQCPPIGAAAFGKMVRRKFNQISTRRLGTRGQSKYHYYGLGVRRGSKYYRSCQEVEHNDISENDFSGALPSFSVFKSKVTPPQEGQCPVFKPMKKNGKVKPETESAPRRDQSCSNWSREEKCFERRIERSLLVMRSFPRSCEISFLPSFIDGQQLDTFLVMYKTHFERLLDSFICDNLQDVQMYCKHFWSMVPNHFQSFLTCTNHLGSATFISSLVEICDQIFYEALEAALIPEDLNDMSEQMATSLTTVSNCVQSWIHDSIEPLPQFVVTIKTRACEEFVRNVRRYLSLVPLVKSCNLILAQKVTIDKMSNDLERIEVQSVVEEDIGLFDLDAVHHVRQLVLFICQSMKHDSKFQLKHLTRLIASTIESFVRNTCPSEMPITEMTHTMADGNQVAQVPEMTSSAFVASNFVPEQTTIPFSSPSSCLITRGVTILLTIGRALSSLSRELTLSNSSSFGYWHLMFLLVNDFSLIHFQSLVRKENHDLKRSTLMSWPQVGQFGHSLNDGNSLMYQEEGPKMTNCNEEGKLFMQL